MKTESIVYVCHTGGYESTFFAVFSTLQKAKDFKKDTPWLEINRVKIDKIYPGDDYEFEGYCK